ncbi:MAG: Rho termination factor N-terminal domain-containing protein [Actinomycetota bacterium]
MSATSKADLEAKHLAELHRLAAEAGVPRYRMLRRSELVEELLGRGGGEGVGDAKAEETEEKPRPRVRRRPRRAKQGEAHTDEDGEAADAEEDGNGVETEDVSGVLEIVRAGHGFLRLKGPEPDPDDVYISASQIRRCELENGDEVEGPARNPREGERHRALIRVERVDGEEPPDEPSDEPPAD